MIFLIPNPNNRLATKISNKKFHTMAQPPEKIKLYRMTSQNIRWYVFTLFLPTYYCFSKLFLLCGSLALPFHFHFLSSCPHFLFFPFFFFSSTNKECKSLEDTHYRGLKPGRGSVFVKSSFSSSFNLLLFTNLIVLCYFDWVLDIAIEITTLAVTPPHRPHPH